MQVLPLKTMGPNALARFERDVLGQPGVAGVVLLMGDTFIDCFTHIKQAEISRHDGAEDKDDWQRREYSSRI